MFDKITSRRFLPIVTAIVAGVILALTLFVFQIGVEDNGTLVAKLSQMGFYDISAASGSGFYSQHLGVADKTISFVPSEIIYTLCKQFFGVDTVMNTMFPAAIYAIIYITGFYFLIKSIMTDIKWSNILSAIACLLIFCDSAYISYFNTPYSYASFLAFLPLFFSSAVSAVKGEKKRWLFVCALSGVFVFGATAVTGVIGVLFFIFFVFYVFKFKKNILKAICIFCSVIILFSSLYALSEVSPVTLYDSTFYGLLYNNENYASETGLVEYIEYSGVPSFEAEAQKLILSGELDNKLSYGKILSGYLENPGILYKNLEIAANNGTAIKTAYLGNYTSLSGKSAGETSGFFSLYSTLKGKFIPNKLLALYVMLILVCYFSVVYKNRYSESSESKLLTGLSFTSSLCSMLLIPATMVLFGITQISFNMFVFNVWFDITVLFAFIGGTKILWLKRQLLKEKYGVNQ